MTEELLRRYAAWRARPLGAVTERLERRAIAAALGEPAGAEILDVGTGDGVHAVDAARRGARVVALDRSATMLRAARARAREARVPVSLVAADAAALPFADRSFDVTMAVTVLCFATDAVGIVREMARVLRPGGRVLLGELGSRSAWSLWRRWRALRGERAWRGVRFRSAGEVADLMRRAGLRDVAVRGSVHYPPADAVAPFAEALEARLGPLLRTAFASFLVATAVRPGGEA